VKDVRIYAGFFVLGKNINTYRKKGEKPFNPSQPFTEKKI